MSNPLIIVIGAYGSGKSEYSINLAKNMYSNGDTNVSLVDLDVVNPFFRSRFMRDRFEQIGIEVIAPEFQYGHADLPMISPRIRGVIQDTHKTVILDVGGDPAGCRALGRFVEDISHRGYSMHFVINTKRPFTTNADEILEMKNNLEFSSKLKITELISNTNLMELTDLELITTGINIINEVAVSQNLLFNTFLTMETGETNYPDEINGKTKMNLEHNLTKPWERNTQGNSFC